MTLTRKQIKAILKGCDGVTPGPWKVGPVDDTVVTHTTNAGERLDVAQIDGDYNQPETLCQRQNAQPTDIAGGGVSPDGGTDANITKTSKNGETSALAPNAAKVAGAEGLASDANSSTISTKMPEGAGNKDRIDGKGGIAGSPAPFLVAPKWAGDHLWIGPVIVGYVSRPVRKGDKRGLIGALSALVGDDAKEFGRDQEKETRAYVEGVVKRVFSASPEAKP